MGDDSSPHLERRKRRQSPPTSVIWEESVEDEVDMDSLLKETNLDDDDDKEESEERDSSKDSSIVTVTVTVHGQGDTS